VAHTALQASNNNDEGLQKFLKSGGPRFVQFDSRKEAHCFDQVDAPRCQSSITLFLVMGSLEMKSAALVAERGLKD
jgi:hypothetical protein